MEKSSKQKLNNKVIGKGRGTVIERAKEITRHSR